MGHIKSLLGVTLILTLVACVTINIYFPAAAAEKAADKVIDEVWGTQPPESTPKPEAEPRSSRDLGRGTVLVWLLERAVPAAHAGDADINVSTPAIKNIQASMRSRHGQLNQYYDNGAVGLTRDGLVAVRDAKAIPLRSRTDVNRWVAAENEDRNALYREIAKANGHPEWEKNIRDTFARQWISRAESGWWYEDQGGRWVRK